MAANEVVIKVRGDTRNAEDAAGRLQGRFEKLSNSMKSVGRTMSTRVTLPILALGGIALKIGGDFQQAMNQVQAVSGATGDEFGALQKQALELGRTTQFSASQAAEGMSFLAMAGFEANEILGAMPATLSLAAAGQLELGEAADIASNILTGYGLTTDELIHANDVLVKTFISTNTNLTQLGEAFKFAAPLASAAGIQFEETAAAIGLLGDAGIQSSMAGTTMRAALVALIDPTTEAQEAMDRLGFSARDSSGEILPLHEIIQQLEGSSDIAGDALAIFGTRAGTGMATLIREGSQSLRDLTKELEDSGGTAKRIGDVQMEGFNGALRKMKSALEGAAIAFSDSGLLVMFESLIDVLAKGFQAFSELPKPIRTAIAVIALLAAAIGPLLIGMGMIVAIAPSVGIAWGVAMGPVGWIILAIAGLVAGLALLVIHFDTIKRVVQENVEKFAAIALTIGLIFPPLGLLIATLTLLTLGWEKTQRIVAEVWNNIITATESGVNKMIDLLNVIIRAWNKLGKVIGMEIDEIATVELPRWTVAMEEVGKGGDELAEKISGQTDDYYTNVNRMAKASEDSAERINTATIGVAKTAAEMGEAVQEVASEWQMHMNRMAAASEDLGSRVGWSMLAISKSNEDVADKLVELTDLWYDSFTGQIEAAEDWADEIAVIGTNVTQRMAADALDRGLTWKQLDAEILASAEQNAENLYGVWTGYRAGDSRAFVAHMNEQTRIMQDAHRTEQLFAEQAASNKAKILASELNRQEDYAKRIDAYAKRTAEKIKAAEKIKQDAIKETQRVMAESLAKAAAAVAAVVGLPSTLPGEGIETGGSASNRGMAMEALAGGPVLDVFGKAFFNEKRTARDFWDLGTGAPETVPLLPGQSFNGGAIAGGAAGLTINILAETVIGERGDIAAFVVAGLEEADSQLIGDVAFRDA